MSQSNTLERLTSDLTTPLVRPAGVCSGFLPTCRGQDGNGKSMPARDGATNQEVSAWTAPGMFVPTIGTGQQKPPSIGTWGQTSMGCQARPLTGSQVPHKGREVTGRLSIKSCEQEI